MTASQNAWFAAIAVSLLLVELGIIAFLRLSSGEHRLQAHIALAAVFALILLLGAIHNAIG
jgi:hypothetical protein